jgi:hypothetical protein
MKESLLLFSWPALSLSLSLCLLVPLSASFKSFKVFKVLNVINVIVVSLSSLLSSSSCRHRRRHCVVIVVVITSLLSSSLRHCGHCDKMVRIFPKQFKSIYFVICYCQQVPKNNLFIYLFTEFINWIYQLDNSIEWNGSIRLAR